MKWYPFIRCKERIEYLLMQPFVWWGKYLAKQSPLPEEYDVVCFFSGYAMGGAEKVNADVLATLYDKRVLVFFTRHSANEALKQLFEKPFATLIDISSGTDNKYRYWSNFIWRGKCAAYIHAQQKIPTVFNGQNNFCYKLFPHLKSHVRKVELIHVAEPTFAWVTHPYVPYIDVRVTPFLTIQKAFAAMYAKLSYPAHFLQRWSIIANQTPIPETLHVQKPNEQLQVYYMGRGGPQKRVWLIDQIAAACAEAKLPVRFHVVGNIRQEFSKDAEHYITFHGMMTDPQQIQSFHEQMDVLLMTSAYEGFPLTVMEAMANAVLPMVTAVDEIPVHVHHMQNGWLLQQPKQESAVVADAVAAIETLVKDKTLVMHIQHQARLYACQHFAPAQFQDAWRKLLLD